MWPSWQTNSRNLYDRYGSHGNRFYLISNPRLKAFIPSYFVQLPNVLLAMRFLNMARPLNIFKELAMIVKAGHRYVFTAEMFLSNNSKSESCTRGIGKSMATTLCGRTLATEIAILLTILEYSYSHIIRD